MTDGTVVTPRLILRSPNAGDESFLRSLTRDPKVRRFLGGVPDQQAQDAAIGACLHPGEGSTFWLIALKSDQRPVGLISLSPHVDGTDTELSYQFDPAVWGQGLATEAVQHILDHAHNSLGLSRIIAETQSANAASRRLLERVGMRASHTLTRFGESQTVYQSVRPASDQTLRSTTASDGTVPTSPGIET